MMTNGQEGFAAYEPPMLSEIGTVHELTLSPRHKYQATSSDFVYPTTRFTFSFNP